MPTIFVEIASYRDSELPKTIASCLKNATFPNNLRFGIVNQVGPESEQQLEAYSHDPRFKIMTIAWQQSRGVGSARLKTNELYGGEAYYLQIDSHMRFAPDWDVRLLNEWQRCCDPRAILSSYPPAYRYDKQGKEVMVASKPNRLVVHDFYRAVTPIFFGKELPGDPTTPQRAAFASGGFQFGPGEVCVTVPYEPEICFIGEEIVHSLRLFSHGYTIYAPIDQVLSHLYIRSKEQKDVHHFWHDFNQSDSLRTIYQAMDRRSQEVVATYLTGEAGALLGNTATRRQFENFAGVDFTGKRVHANTYAVPPLPMAADDSWRQRAIAAQKQT